MEKWKLLKSGKVRDIYESNGGSSEYILVRTTDRTSAFDRNIATEIPGRGAILTRMTYIWAMMIEEMIDVGFNEDKEALNYTSVLAILNERDLLMDKLEMIPIECIVRGYLTGSALEDYQKTGKVFGYEMPEGLVEGSKLPEPIFTPTTKAAPGEKDEPINFEDCRRILSDFCGDAMAGHDSAQEIRNQSILLYKMAYDYAYQHGIIIADTKFEFGFWGSKNCANIRFADEILTPDSSRFWSVADYKEGQVQASLDKQPLRDFLKANPEYKEKPLPQEIVDETYARYQKVYDMLFGDLTP